MFWLVTEPKHGPKPGANQRSPSLQVEAVAQSWVEDGAGKGKMARVGTGGVRQHDSGEVSGAYFKVVLHRNRFFHEIVAPCAMPVTLL
jgi:hypothetical protein